MNNISLWHLSYAFIPVAITLLIMFKWSMDTKHTLYALFRMTVQLLLVGYLLNSIFSSESHTLIISLLCIMLFSASWIALQNIPNNNLNMGILIFISISISGLFTLVIMTQAVLSISPWFKADVIIPIAGMIFANTMNTISLSGERFYAELEHQDTKTARNKAFHAGLIPITNSLLAVGIVTLPGLMTGQILSGVEPLIAVRYQIMVMCMILGSGGIATALFLHLLIKSEKL